jgi:signal transduction histidine kinase
LLVLSATAWGLLVLGCFFAHRESGSLLERSRARALLWGSAVVPPLPLVLAVALDRELPGGAASLVAGTAALLPLPVGYAIVRHRLFDLEIDLRRGVSRLLTATGTTLVICVAVVGASSALGSMSPLGDPAVFFAAAFVGVLAGEPLRSRLRGAVRHWVEPSTAPLERRSQELAQRMAECVDPAGCARLLCDSVADGLDRSTSVFLWEERLSEQGRSAQGLWADASWQLVHARGASALIDASAAERAARVTRTSGLVHLAREEVHREPSAVLLRGDGIELVARLRSANEDVALLLVAAPRRGMALATPELGFLAAVVRHAALGIHNAQLARSVVAAERAAARGRAGAALVHDLGKPLGVIERLAMRLPRQPATSPRAAEDADTIESLAREMRATLGSADPRLRRPDACTETALDELIDRAVQLASRSHGHGRIAVRIAPGHSPVIGPVEPIIRVLVNLLDNALLASRSDDVVEVAARGDARRLEIDVIDRGCGMSPVEMQRACEPFFTTRCASGGSGLGLTICRDLLESMGGKLVLSSSPGLGTRVRVELSIGVRG